MTVRLDSAVLVVAHPDDEVLWFSSIVGQVGRVIICHEDCPELPELGPGRAAARQAYPLSSASWLRLTEPGSLDWVDWTRPVATPYGMALDVPGSEAHDARYRATYDALRAELRGALAGASEVFTHNPWGEYGHPDHVQLSRVVADLAPELGFRARYSGYIAPRSMPFAVSFLPRLTADLRLATSAALAARIKALYEQHGCWTWDRAYEPAPEESFLVDIEQAPPEGTVMSLNCVRTE